MAVPSPYRAGLAGTFAVLILSAAGPAQQKAKPPARRVAVARLESPAGTLLARETPGAAWQVLPPRKDVFAGSGLLALPGLRGAVEVKEGLRLSLLGALPEASGVPVLESAVTLSPQPAADLDVSLDRGRVLVTRGKGQKPARMRVRFLDQSWNLALAEPGTEVALERVGGWPPGVPFEKESRPGHRPVTDVYLLLLRGRVDLNDGSEQHALAAPVVYHWNSERGVDGPVPLRKVPAWVSPAAVPPAGAKPLPAAAERLRERLAADGVTAALRKTRAEGDSAGRVVAVYDAGAVGELPLVLSALGDAKQPEVRGAAVATLRHWIGRAPGQDQKLFEVLVKNGYRPGQAGIFMQLLHTFSAQDRDRPETYETLIDYLNHDQVGIRELAHWHLTRMVPKGREIPFNPAATAAERASAVAAWRRLIPAGKLPPRGG